MKKTLRLAIAQVNPILGDFEYNLRLLRQALDRSAPKRPDLVIFPEMSLCGYPPEDLLLRRSFLQANARALEKLRAQSQSLPAMIVGFAEGGESPGKVYNSAAVLFRGHLQAVYRKRELPNYGVFDEQRYFEPGDRGLLVDIEGVKIGITICEDIWLEDNFATRAPYRDRTSLIINISASPYHVGKQDSRYRIVRALASKTGAAVAYVNLVGGQDELVFDGSSFLVDARGQVLAQAAAFAEDLLITDVELPIPASPKKDGHASDRYEQVAIKSVSRPKPFSRVTAPAPAKLHRDSEIYKALTLGTHDYVMKNGFDKVVIGLSGGIDSALVACVAVDALGPGRVLGATMPSPYTSSGTYNDAKALAKNLGIRLMEFSIEPVMKAYEAVLRKEFSKTKDGTAEENLQARARGNLLMALSNKFGYLVLTTGNKSEFATGYCTLYGDMAGGFAVLKDVPKTTVYALSRYRNGQSKTPPIPESTLRRAPTAELRHGQKDQDILPDYAVLDQILEEFVERDRSPDQIQVRGADRTMVQKVVGMVLKNEYKRRQAPPGIKITPKAFGRDRRMPITHRFRS